MTDPTDLTGFMALMTDYEDDQGTVTYCHRECLSIAVRAKMGRALRDWVADEAESDWVRGVLDAAKRIELGR